MHSVSSYAAVVLLVLGFVGSNGPKSRTNSAAGPRTAVRVAIPLEGACGACDDDGVELAAGTTFAWGPFYDTLEEVEAALADMTKVTALRDAWYAELTSYWACPECWDLVPCKKYVQTFGVALEAGAEPDPVTGQWQMYGECEKGGTVVPCCTACPY